MFGFLNKTEYSLRKQSYWLFIGKTIAFVLNLITPIILVRILTKHDYGTYRFSIVISLTILPILAFGLNTSLYYFYPISTNNRSKIIRQTFTLLFLVGSLLLLIYYIIYGFYYENSSLGIVIKNSHPIAVLIYFDMISSTINHIFILEKRAYLNAIYLIGEQLIKSIFILITAFYYKSAYFILWGLAGFNATRTFFFIWYIIYRYKGLFIKLEKKEIKKQIKYALPFAGANSIAEIGKKIDRFAVTAIAGLEKFSSYSVANFKAPLLATFFQSIFQIIIPKISLYSKNNDTRSAKSLWHKGIIKSAMLAIPCLFFLEITAASVIPLLFTKDYMDSIVPYRIVLLIILFQMTGYGIITRAFDKTKIYLKASVICLILGIILAFILTKLFGIIGAAISGLITFGVYTGIILNEDRKILELSITEALPFQDIWNLIKISGICALPVVITYYTFNNINESIKLILCFIIYFVLIGFVYFFKSYIFEDIKKIRNFKLKSS